MKGSIYEPEDIRRMIKAVAGYCEPKPGGGPPVCWYSDLKAFALDVLKVRCVKVDGEWCYEMAPDYRRRLELVGINPDTFEIEDQKEFSATVAMLEWRRQQREAAKTKRRKKRGETRGWYTKGERGSVPYVPETNGSQPWLKTAEPPEPDLSEELPE